jgi:hypothetical protein
MWPLWEGYTVLFDAPRAHFLRSEPIKGWPLEPLHRQIGIDLSPMMNLMLDHRPEPLPNRQLGSAWSHALPKENVPSR